MRVHKTGHAIADTVSDLIGELPDGDYKVAYGILRHSLFNDGHWFEIDKGMWGASHYDGLYRMSYRGTQPIWRDGVTGRAHGLRLGPWINRSGRTLILPPTDHVCRFFKINKRNWMLWSYDQIRDDNCPSPMVREKDATWEIDWSQYNQVITFNSSLGIDALIRGIPVISDPIHSTIGSYCAAKKCIDGYDRDELLSFIQANQFKLTDKERVWEIISMYLSDMTAEKL